MNYAKELKFSKRKSEEIMERYSKALDILRSKGFLKNEEPTLSEIDKAVKDWCIVNNKTYVYIYAHLEELSVDEGGDKSAKDVKESGKNELDENNKSGDTEKLESVESDETNETNKSGEDKSKRRKSISELLPD